MGLFERYLSLWVALCIVSGIALGTLFPGVFQIFADLEYASVNLPIAVLIWLMIYPMMVQVSPDPEQLVVIPKPFQNVLPSVASFGKRLYEVSDVQ